MHSVDRGWYEESSINRNVRGGGLRRLVTGSFGGVLKKGGLGFRVQKGLNPNPPFFKPQKNPNRERGTSDKGFGFFLGLGFGFFVYLVILGVLF